MSSYGAIIKKNIEKLLKERNWRIVDLENKANKGRIVHNILYRDSPNPSIDIMKAIASALNVEIEDLISEDNKNDDILNPKLFLDSCNKVITELIPIHEQFSIKQSGALKLIQEVYKYSKDLSLEKADPNFVKWLVQQHYKK